jgi:hypothetical protein
MMNTNFSLIFVLTGSILVFLVGCSPDTRSSDNPSSASTIPTTDPIELAKQDNHRIRDAAFAAGRFNDPVGFQLRCGRATSSKKGPHGTVLVYVEPNFVHGFGFKAVAVSFKQNKREPTFLWNQSNWPTQIFVMKPEDALSELGCW